MCLETELISGTDFHFLPGRFRVAVAAVKGDPVKAAFLAEQLTRVAHVSGYINPLTGRILLLYDQKRVHPRLLLETIARAAACLRQPVRPEGGEQAPWHLLSAQQVLKAAKTSYPQGLS